MTHHDVWENLAITLIGLASIFNAINLRYTRKRLDRMQDAVNTVRHLENFRAVYFLEPKKGAPKVDL